MGLLANLHVGAATRALQVYAGASAVMSPDALGDLLEAAGAKPKDVLRARMAGLRQDSMGGNR